MKARLPSLLFLSLIMGTPAALAEEDFDLGGDFGMDEEEAAPAPWLNFVTLKLNFVSDDNFSFSKYRDFGDEGFDADLDLRYRSLSSTSFWTLEIDDLGRDGQDLRLLWRNASNLTLDFSYQETLWNDNNTGITPFSGTSTLTLPATWVPGVNTSSFAAAQFANQFDQDLLRKRLSLTLDKRFSSQFDVGASFAVEEKTGTYMQGMAIYSNAANPQAVLLPAPVDQETTEFEIYGSYTLSNLSVSGRYWMTDFDNNLQAISWQNPYVSGLGAAVDYPNGFGSYAPSPDYEHVGYSVSAAYRFGRMATLTIDAAETETEQQEPLLPYSGNTLWLTVPLPATAMDASLETSMLNVALLTRPMDKVNFNLRYRFNERDNTATRYAWNYVRGDAANPVNTDSAVYNKPLNHEFERYTAEAIYRLPDSGKLQLAYDFEEKYRNYAAVTKTEEDIFSFRLHVPRTEHFTHRFEAELSKLDGSTYEWSRSFFQTLAESLINQIPDNVRWTNHPLLRQYHVAYQEEMKFRWLTNWTPTDAWLLQLVAEDRSVDFDRSELGLREVTQSSANFSVTYMGSESYNSWMYLNYTDGMRLQFGRDFTGGLQKPANDIYPPLVEGSDPARNWAAAQNTDTFSIGFGMEWTVSDTLSVNANYAYMWAEEDYLISMGGARDLVGDDLPTVEYELHTLTTSIDYVWSENLKCQLAHQYYSYSDNNWQYSGLALATMAKVLATGQQNPDESINLITLALSYKF